MHGLVMVYFPTPDDPVFRCLCWHIASGVTKSIWSVITNLDGTVALSPSVNFPEHFHDFYHNVKVASSMAELAINPKWNK